MTLNADIRGLPIVGGNLALDLANTTSERHGGTPRERLLDYDDVVTWARRVNLVSAAHARALREAAERHPRLAATALERVRAFREMTYRIFSAIANGRKPAAADLAHLTAALRESTSHRELDWNRGPRWKRISGGDDLAALLRPVADNAESLLFGDELGRVKECHGEDCNWLFVDSSRNRSRRWCDMADCGNRSKARRFYSRSGGLGAPGPQSSP
ncbi:MAG: CGNR zinc finger domain-containing protein [Gemmatimonadales bacterium]